MSKYDAPLTDIRFVLYDVLDVETIYATLPGGENAPREIIDAVLDEAARFTGQVLAPLNKSGDQEGCHWDNAVVTTPKGFKQAYAQWVEGGWPGINLPEQYGGQHLPESIGGAVKEMIESANLAWGTYTLLSHGAAAALIHHGEEWQREVFLKPITHGNWTGTMCLTEPHCGTDLGLLKTKAEAQADGSYSISGTKIFITAGEHDLADNIIHLVLARLPDAPAGTKGISLFIVPKFKVDQAGNVGERNALACGSIEHKMGIKGSATCVMNFDGAQGWLIGPLNKGLNCMFTMMNAARVGVGVQGLGLIERAYQNSLAYARDRLQMRSLSGPKRPGKPADPIIVHPDIRRMLLKQKAFAEAGRALVYDAYIQVELADRSTDPATQKHAEELLSFLTPIVKALMTEMAIECTIDAQQIFGGHGYIQEWGMEQFVRDARITTIYEGTTQIQALDLLGRKIMALQGVGFRHFLDEVGAFCKAQTGNAGIAEFVGPLAKVAQEWAELTQEVAASAVKNPEEIGAAAIDYLYYSGYITLAYYWARIVIAAQNSKHGDDFKQAKLHTARFYYARILPRTLSHVAMIRAGSASLMDMPEEQFAVG